MLGTDFLQELFSDIFSPIYMDGQLVRVTMTKDPKGLMVPVPATPVDIKVQKDSVTERMRTQPGYTEKDVRVLILQHGVGAMPTTDDWVDIPSGTGGPTERWKLFGIEEDPGRTYWEARGVLQASA